MKINFNKYSYLKLCIEDIMIQMIKIMRRISFDHEIKFKKTMYTKIMKSLTIICHPKYIKINILSELLNIIKYDTYHIIMQWLFEDNKNRNHFNIIFYQYIHNYINDKVIKFNIILIKRYDQ